MSHTLCGPHKAALRDGGLNPDAGLPLAPNKPGSRLETRAVAAPSGEVKGSFVRKGGINIVTHEKTPGSELDHGNFHKPFA